MAEIVGGGNPANDAERRVIAHLRDHAPGDWLLLHNIEVPHPDGSTFEVDVIVVTDHDVCVIDVKGTRGRIEVAGPRWYPSRRAPFPSPVAKLKGNARALKGQLTRRRPQELRSIYVDHLVVLTAPDAELIDPDEWDRPHVVSLDGLIPALRDVSRVPDRFTADTTPHRTPIIEALHGSVRPSTAPLRFGNWEVRERLGGNDTVTEYRAVNATTRTSETVLLRVYRADPMADTEQRTAERRRIANAYETLTSIPPHPCVVRSRDFFPIEDESRFVLVLDDVPGQALHLHLTDPRQALTADARLRVIENILQGLAHAHAHQVAHRALSPATVLVTERGRALLTGFDYAKPGTPREHTVVGELPKVLDQLYVAPECQGRPERLGPQSDVYAAGVIAFQILTGEPPFTSPADQWEKGSVLPEADMAAAGVAPELAVLLGRMCDLEPSRRPSAAEALREIRRIRGGRRSDTETDSPSSSGPTGKVDYARLPENANYQLTGKYTVLRRLGKGTYGTAYHVYDDFADDDRVVKIVHRAPESQVERIKREFQILIKLAHPNVVKAEEANYLDGTRIPYLALEYVEGVDVSEVVKRRLLGPADAVRLAADVARGLAYLHDQGVYHCDIKPSNLIWTDKGCRIIDFNVAVTSETSLSEAGGTHRYTPPDLNTRVRPTAGDLVDRDVYALGVTLYEVLTGLYPWDTITPPPGRPPRDIRSIPGLDDLSDALVETVNRAVAPRRSDRFADARKFLEALESIGDEVRRRPVPPPPPAPDLPTPGVNPFVTHLQTLYSQSSRSNAGTRGRDPFKLYVETALDRHLLPDVLAGRHGLVIITGNAGDGKTAFLETVLAEACKRGGQVIALRENGADFSLGGRTFRTNYDGSQDEGETDNTGILLQFFAPFGGNDESAWSTAETRLIAINEGRLVDFLIAHADRFARLGEVVRAGLRGEPTPDGVAIVNLNRRSVLADLDELNGSIFDRVLASMTDPRRWEACGSCELASVCYAPHNARTLAHPSAGRHITRRLKDLYLLTHLRGRLHITVRDLRSALAFTLTSGRDCAEIHRLYADGAPREILDGFYFNSWAGPVEGNDRLLSLLREVDVAATPDPALDRRLDYVGPDGGSALLRLDQRGNHDEVLLKQFFAALPRTPAPTEAERRAHRDYLSAARRRFYFECVDGDRARRMLPYVTADRFMRLLNGSGPVSAHLPELIDAINRSEGLTDPRRLGDVLALQPRHVPGGTIRSYRLFPQESLALEVAETPESPYLEGGPDALVLRYHGPAGHTATLRIQLDLYEMLQRLRDGYLPGAAELRGLYRSLDIFKNELSAAPYREILLTTTGRDLWRIRREDDGRLVMERPGMEGADDGAQA